MDTANPLGLKGIEFVEFTSPRPAELEKLFFALGFSKTHEHKNKGVTLFRQNDMHFLLNDTKGTHADGFRKSHGPSISGLGLRVKDANAALAQALSRGAEKADGDYHYHDRHIPAIKGIGGSLIYFVEPGAQLYAAAGFDPLAKPVVVKEKGFVAIDHLTNNVEKGTMQKWADFYKKVFGFTEVRYFDIRGAKTGLVSYALRSPCGTFCIPINEGTDKKSQINEYLEEYNGPGIQHLAFLTNNILKSLDALAEEKIATLDIDDSYYETVFERVPNVTEDKAQIKKHQVLVDGDEKGYLLQIFTKNLVGPIFLEIIQRKNHFSFGEGNFGALFRSIEKDQEKRGYV